MAILSADFIASRPCAASVRRRGSRVRYGACDKDRDAKKRIRTYRMKAMVDFLTAVCVSALRLS